MRRMALVLSMASVGVFASRVAAQEKPNFSGRWTTEPAAPAANAGGGARGARGGQGGRGGGADLGSGWGPTITVTQDASKLTVEYMFFGRGDMQPPLKFVYALDGSETKNSVMMGRGIQEQASRAAWDGGKLVITTMHTFASPETGAPMKNEVKQALTLESPTSLLVETTRSGALGGPSSTSQTRYRKL